MKKFSQIATKTDARSFIEHELAELSKSDRRSFKSMIYLISKLINVFGESVESVSTYEFNMVGLAGAIEAVARQEGSRVNAFAPILFVVLKFDFLVNERTIESSRIVQTHIFNSTLFVLDLPADSTTIGAVKLYPDYAQFIKDVESHKQIRRSKPVPRPQDIQLQEALDSLLETIPKNATYEQKARSYEELKQAFNHKVAADLGDDLKAEMLRRGKDLTTYDEKLELVRWVNGELRRFGLALSTSKTGVSILAAAEGGRGGGGRFQLKGKTKDEDGRFSTFNPTDIYELVKNIDVVEAPPRREGLAERVGRETETPTAPGRGR